MKYIAVDGCKVEIQSPFSGTVTITSVPSTVAKAGGKGIYKTPLAFSISGVAGPGIANGAGAGAIPATSTTTKAEKLYVMRKDDSIIVVATGVLPAPPSTPISLPVTVKITDAGQDKVKSK